MSAARFFSGLLMLLLSFNALAQTKEEELKEKLQKETKLLEQILSDAQNFRLPENRAFVLSRVGNSYWKLDEKFARKLFQDSITALLAAQAEVENEKGNKQYFQNLIYGQSPRLEIISLIATRDPEYALEVFFKTRPPRIAQALANFTDDNQSIAQAFARNELQTEQRLLALAAEQNPETAIARVRESLKRGITYETLNLLKKIYTKDADAANRLAEEMGRKFLEMDFPKSYQTLEMLGYFINELGREKSAEEKTFKISEQLLRDLVLKMIDFWLDPKNTQLYGYWNSAGVVEKLFPDRAARVKQKLEKINSQNSTPETLEYNKLIQSNATADELLARAEKFSSSYKNELYRTAAAKLAESGNIAQAEKILSTNISEEASDQYLSQFYVNLTYQLISQGKFEEARRYANQIPDESQRVNALIYLANAIFQKNPKENQKSAESVLAEVRSLIPETPETQGDLNSVVNLAMAYAPIEPKESFLLIETLTGTLNELAQAHFVMAKFRNYGGFRQGELQMPAGNSMGVYNLENLLRTLKNTDLDRALQFTAGFNRPEIRVMFELQLIDENLLNGVLTTNLPIITRMERRRF